MTMRSNLSKTCYPYRFLDDFHLEVATKLQEWLQIAPLFGDYQWEYEVKGMTFIDFEDERDAAMFKLCFSEYPITE